MEISSKTERLQALEMLEELGELTEKEQLDLARARAIEKAKARVTAINNAKARVMAKQKAEQGEPSKQELDAMIAELEGKPPASKRSFGDAFMDNIVGRDDGVMSYGEKLGSFLNKAGESMTLGLVGDEASASAESVLMGADYEKRRDHYRQQERQLQKENPYIALGAELAPAAIPGLGTFGAAMKGGNLLRGAALGGAVAGAQGATYGFMEGEGGLNNRLEEAKQAGQLSAGLGAVAAPVARGVGRFADWRAQNRATKQMVRTAPSVDDLTSQAGQLYAKGEARGQILSPKAAQRLADDALGELRAKGVMRSNGQIITRDPETRQIIEELSDLAQNGLRGVEVKPVRALFQKAASDSDPARARIGAILLTKLDDAVKREAPEFAEGDTLYSRAMKARDVDRMLDMADTSDTANALRREFQKADRRQISGRAGSMTPDEIEAMQRVARGTRGEKFARTLGRSAPRSVSGALFTGSTPFVAGSLAGSPAIGAAVGASALGMGMAGRAMSNRAQRRYAEIAKALIASGGRKPKTANPSALREALIAAIMGLPARGATAYTTGP